MNKKTIGENNSSRISVEVQRRTMVKDTDFEEPGDITGVTHAKINEFPWIVRLGSTKKDIISIDYQGSIISPNYVITSGYCVHDKTKEKLFCVVGVNDLNKYSTGKEGMKLKVKDIIMHEEYAEHATGILNNIALIKLAHPLNLGKCGVDAIKLPPEGSGYCGKTATVAGWGMNRITLQNGKLMKRKLRIHTKKKCRTFMKNKLYEKNSLLYVTMNSAPSCYVRKIKFSLFLK
uniref:Peptidase S1 domain-containing protein n=1 Tax=Rhodnius prolixus TaxID=13249 RepID=T1H8M7_RHOPR